MADRRVRGDRGVSAIELAVIAPTLLLLIFLAIQAGLFFYARSVALQAAREGVSQLRLAQTPGDCAAQSPLTSDAVNSYLAHVGTGALNGARVSPDCGSYAASGTTGPTVTVTVHGHAISLLGFTLSVDESATGQVERFQEEG